MFCTFRKRTPAQKRNPSDVPVLISFSLCRYTRNVLYIIYVIYCLELVRSNNNKRIYIYIRQSRLRPETVMVRYPNDPTPPALTNRPATAPPVPLVLSV